MEIGDLEALLRQHGIDTASLEPVLSRGDERIYQLLVPTREVIDQWQRLRALVDETGHWPVVGWGSRWLDEAPEYRAHLEGGSTAEILAESEKFDLERWKQTLMDEFLAFVREQAEAHEVRAVTDYFADAQGAWPEDVVPYAEFKISRPTEKREPIRPLPIALVPTTQSWQLPAYLRFDTGSTSPAVDAAMARRWYERYGAEIVGMLPDTIEMQVARSPTTREEALALAKEQYIYCPDIVDQGTRTIQALAAGLLNGTAWFFWWD